MTPAASVSGLYLAHPEARYFSVGRIGRDQVDDYAARKEIVAGRGRALAAAESRLLAGRRMSKSVRSRIDPFRKLSYPRLTALAGAALRMRTSKKGGRGGSWGVNGAASPARRRSSASMVPLPVAPSRHGARSAGSILRGFGWFLLVVLVIGAGVGGGRYLYDHETPQGVSTRTPGSSRRRRRTVICRRFRRPSAAGDRARRRLRRPRRAPGRTRTRARTPTP